MKYFLDTEFIESGPGRPIHLISIGIVAEDGREFYAINSDCPLAFANDWVKANVLPHLNHTKETWLPLEEIARQVEKFCRAYGFDGTQEFWAYYADYDWVVFCQMFGTMMNLPNGFPMYCNDIKQWASQLENPKLPPQSTTEHNALNDARWNREAWEYLAALHASTSDTERAAKLKDLREGGKR